MRDAIRRFIRKMLYGRFVTEGIGPNRAERRRMVREALARPSSRHYRKGHVEHCTVVAMFNQRRKEVGRVR